MKKAALIMATTVLALALAGCGTAQDNPAGAGTADNLPGATVSTGPGDSSAFVSTETSSTKTEKQTIPAESDNTTEAGGKTGGKGPDGTAAQQSAEASGGSHDEAFGLVAKSNNAVSGKDKEDVLNELNKELDSLFSNINRLEDVKDSDLKLD